MCQHVSFGAGAPITNTYLWPAHRCCCPANRAHLVPGTKLQHSGASHAGARRAAHLQAPTLLTAPRCMSLRLSHSSSVWRTCVDFFAAGACHDHRRHVLQRRLDWRGRVRIKWRELCIALMTVCTVLPCMIMVLPNDAHRWLCGQYRRLRRAEPTHGH